MRAAVSETGPELKQWIAAIHAYTPGQSAAPDGRPLVKLSANENPLGTSPKALAARAEAPGPAEYPDPDATKLREALGAFHGIEPERIVCGTGSDELLNLVPLAYAGPGDEVLYVRYGFMVYDIAARRAGATPVVAPDRDYATDVDALLASVTERTRVVFLANPNNPTGTYLPRGELARLHAGLPGHALLVIDQAYAEYLDPAEDDGGLALAAEHGNVLVTRTFSKIYGLAGERVGWGTGASDIVAALNRIRAPFNVTVSGQRAALAALSDQAFVTAAREHNRRQRQRLAASIEALGNFGLRAVPSEANFLLVLFDGALTAEAALAGLAERGYAVRHLPGQGLANGLRITVGTAEQVDAIAEGLRQMAESAG